MNRDARANVAIAAAAWVVALAAPRPATPVAVAVLAGGGLAVRGRLSALRALVPALGAGAIAAGLRAWLAPRGLEAGALLLARVAGAGAVGAWLAASTPFPRLLGALAWLRAPAPLLDLLALANRQRHALAERAATVREAQRLRLGWDGFGRSLRSAGALAGLATLRAVAQADATADALALRGIRGAILPAPPGRLAAGELLRLSGAALALAGCVAIGALP